MTQSRPIAASAASATVQVADTPAPVTESLIETVKQSSGIAPAPFEGEGWKPLFNGTNLVGWEPVSYGAGGDVEAGSGLLLLNMGEPFTGLRYTNQFPTLDYEIAFEAMRVMGSDFFCALTVPVENSHCTLVLGGWGGSLVGISSINGLDASENETTKFEHFEKMRWYRVRMRVTADRIEAWLDKDKIVDVVNTDSQLSLRPGEIELCKPLGLATWQTAGAYRNLQWRYVETPADPPPKRL